MIKKIFFTVLMLGALLLPVHAQGLEETSSGSGEILWSIISYNVNNVESTEFHFSETDGSSLTQISSNPPIDQLGRYADSFVNGGDGNMYGIRSRTGSTNEGTVIKISPDGIFKLRDIGERFYLPIIFDGGDGFVYTIEYTSYYSRANLHRIRYDGTDYQQAQFPAITTFRPTPEIIHASDGYFYGISTGGGDFLKGFIYRFDSSLAGFEIIHSFQGTNGIGPLGGVVEGPDGYLYGITNRGGSNSQGIIFKVKKDGTDFIKLQDFTGKANGRYPVSSMVYNSRDDYFYGYTQAGGTFQSGVIFKIRPDGSSFTKIFQYGESCLPATCPGLSGNILLDNDDNLYLISGRDQRIKLKTDGTISTVDLPIGNYIFGTLLTSPAASNIVLEYPQNESIDISNTLDALVTQIPYATQYVIEISEQSDFQTGTSFTSDSNTIPLNGLEYGITYYARVKTNVWPTFGATSSFTTEDLPDQVRLWGVTTKGGTMPCEGGDGGTIFSILPDGTSFMKHVDYDCASDTVGGNTGKRLDRSLIKGEDGMLYGVSINNPFAFYNTGYHDLVGFVTSGDEGEIFRIDNNGNNFTTLYNDLGIHYFSYFTFASDGDLYVTSPKTGYGPAKYDLIRKFKTDGSTDPLQSAIYTFSYGTDGSVPRGMPIELPDGYLYGVTMNGGDYGRGIIYKVKLDGSGYTRLHSFEGGLPRGGLLDGKDGFLYGMDYRSYGTIYKIRTDGSDFSVLHHFGAPNSSNGRQPYSTLIEANDILYGMTPNGGQHSKGVIFSIQKDGSGFNIIHHFSGAEGEIPLGDLTFDGDGNLYGMTSAGGRYNLGTIFSLTLDGGVLNKLFDFSMETGGAPDGKLLITGPELENKSIASSSTREVPSAGPESVRSDIFVYPNPSRHAFTLEMHDNNEDFSQAVLLDISGRELSRYDLSSNTPLVFGEGLTSGVYILKVKNGASTKTFRLMKE